MRIGIFNRESRPFTCLECKNDFELTTKEMVGRKRPHCPSCDSQNISRKHTKFRREEDASKVEN